MFAIVNLTTALYLTATLIAAFLWAKLEIEIEGEHGWAANLPTWRVEKHPALELFFGGRPLTGYHVWAFTSVGFFFHLPFLVMGHWSLALELRALGSCCVFWVVEDYLWFVMNPHFGWRKFRQENIWWHRRWLLRLPLDYWILGAIGGVLIFL
jgi:hypothetical protein